jgi:glycosyltransferase involved in cell wall biosynthesis
MPVPEPGLRVLIDDGMSTSRFLTGIGHHCVGLADALSRIVDCRLTDYGPIRFVPRLFRRFIYILAVNLATPFRGEGIVHFQNYYVPRFRGSKIVVVTIQDLTAFRFPDTLPSIYLRYARKAIAQAVVRSDLVIVPLAAVRADLHDVLPESRNKRTEVCPDGLRESFRAPSAAAGVRLPAGLQPNGYFLSVGTIERRKNLALLVRAFLAWRGRGGVGMEFRLVLAGRPGFGSAEVLALLSGGGPVVHLAGLKDPELAALYGNCRAVIFPSLYEGFGLPLVEAMSMGAPVIASDIPTTRELHAAHGCRYRLFEKDRQEDLVRCMEDAYRAGAASRPRVDYGDLSGYFYENVARRHVEVYRSLMET